ncbi:MAG: radical SAM protein, partial [Candidatus Omnitrophica bacterium]|nr:radical SAM protein [Candidatus Omnitrophota bacterium]
GLPSAVVQFSRGCPRKCSYCGQWDFWKRWRRRSIESFVEEIESLSAQGIRLFWIADENWSVDRNLFINLLDSLKAVNRSHHLIVAMECAHVIRDVQEFKLYSEAGISMVMLGLDNSDSNSVNPSEKKVEWKELGEAIEALRRVGIISIVNRFTAHESRSFRDRNLKEISPDFYNFLYPTPHNWTRLGEEKRKFIVERDLTKWDYRHPVIGNSEADLILQRWRTKVREFHHNLSSAMIRAFVQRQSNPLTTKSTSLVAGVYFLELWELIRDSTTYIAENVWNFLHDRWTQLWVGIRRAVKNHI